MANKKTWLSFTQQIDLLKNRNLTIPPAYESNNKLAESFLSAISYYRLIIRDLELDGINFTKGEAICIVPDALYFSQNPVSPAQITSSIAGAPDRYCMGLNISSNIVKEYEIFFLKNKEIIEQYQISYEFKQTVQALEFKSLCLQK